MRNSENAEKAEGPHSPHENIPRNNIWKKGGSRVGCYYARDRIKSLSSDRASSVRTGKIEPRNVTKLISVYGIIILAAKKSISPVGEAQSNERFTQKNVYLQCALPSYHSWNIFAEKVLEVGML